MKSPHHNTKHYDALYYIA